jgi:hypothetical protein
MREKKSVSKKINACARPSTHKYLCRAAPKTPNWCKKNKNFTMKSKIILKKGIDMAKP